MRECGKYKMLRAWSSGRIEDGARMEKLKMKFNVYMSR